MGRNCALRLFIFDEGGVISRNFMIGGEAARRMGISHEEFYRYIADDEQAFMRGDFDCAELWRRFEKKGGPRPAENYWATLFRPTVDAPTFDLVNELRAGLRREAEQDSRAAGRVVCGTNTIGVHYDYHKAHGQYDCFDEVYASQIMRHAKPEPEFWQYILDREKTAPENTFFADDFVENVEAAAAMGIKARLYTDAARLRQDLVELGAPVASDSGNGRTR